MELVRHVNSGNLRPLKSILDTWVDVILQRYIDYLRDEPDYPWWHNERANVSTLAAAAWIAGGVALEEYGAQKGKKSSPRTGRIDLFIATKKSRHCFEFEAKQAWCAVGPRAYGPERAGSSLEKACKAAKDLQKWEQRRLGLCFAVPYMPEREGDKDYVDKQIGKWLDELNQVSCDCIAWAFPEEARCYPGADKNIYPGVALLAKEV